MKRFEKEMGKQKNENVAKLQQQQRHVSIKQVSVQVGQ